MSDASYQQAMDERLKQALDFANYRATFNKLREQLKLKLNQDLTVSINGGSFQASKELITFVYVLKDGGETDAVLIDVNDNPIKIVDLTGFLAKLLHAYTAGTNEYLVKLQKLRAARTVEALLTA